MGSRMKWVNSSAAERHDLIRQARARASGADVHRVESLCAAYVLFLALAEKGELVERECDQVEAALQAYVHTGRLPSAEWIIPGSSRRIGAPLIPFREGTVQSVFEESRRLRERSRMLRGASRELGDWWEWRNGMRFLGAN